MLARKLLRGFLAVAATSMMILGVNAPAQAATTALPYCNSWIPLHPDSGFWEGRGMLPATSTGSANCILATGNNSSGVKALQIGLNSCYAKKLATDGIFGTATYNALMAVQRQIGATIDGIYGPGTRTKMQWNGGSGCHPITYYQGF
jgi:peptidoglycan hydrolase-like protein with peptidoglycan-binding domain